MIGGNEMLIHYEHILVTISNTTGSFLLVGTHITVLYGKDFDGFG